MKFNKLNCAKSTGCSVVVMIPRRELKKLTGFNFFTADITIENVEEREKQHD